MRYINLILLVLMTSLILACHKDSDTNEEGVLIRVANSGHILLQTVVIDNNTFVDIPPAGISEYQKFQSEIGLPPSYFAIKTEIGERGLVYDYIAGAKLENGSYTYEISMNEEAEVNIKFPPD